jgi:hypothetical protein
MDTSSGGDAGKTWIEKYGQLITAVSTALIAALSFGVAVVSLNVSTAQQQEDTAHKELLIRPFLLLPDDRLSLQLNLVNSGLGPAKIWHVALSFPPDVCIDSSRMTAEKWSAAIEQAGEQLISFMYGPFLDAIKKANPYAQPNVELINLDELIPGNAHGKTLIGIKAPTGLVVPDEARQEHAALFKQNLNKFNIVVDYCSMTNKFCSRVSRGQVSCSRP